MKRHYGAFLFYRAARYIRKKPLSNVSLSKQRLLNEKKMLSITYIFHSSFLVTTPKCSIIFDFWKDPYGMIHQLIDADKPVYVIVSHFHKDHFNKDIFTWASKYKDIRFILSKDTAQRARYIFSPTSTHSGPHLDKSCLTVLRPGEAFCDNLITVNAFGSTDEGNSYLVSVDGKTIFHAGDLNAWIWKDESSQKEVDDALALFRKKLEPISEHLSGDNDKIDVALFPVDSRLGTDYWEGAKIFLHTFRVGTFIPMHYGLGTEEEQLRRRFDAARFDRYADPSYPTEFIGPLQTYGSVSKLNEFNTKND